MRKQFCDALVKRSAKPDMHFITGDLGFMALEPLRESMGSRFLNAGVAEQNMITVAAAMAKEGLDTWVYSIAPFCYARPFEQIRNDICFHNLPVKLVGNGGGYGYGVMGPTHHAVEDYGVLLTLPNMRVYVPAFDEDVEAVVMLAGANDAPTYLRLGRGEPPTGYIAPAYAPWRQVCQGQGMCLVATGPVSGLYIESCLALPEATRPNFWIVSEFPMREAGIPPEFFDQLSASETLCVVEEHVARGGLASELLLLLAETGRSPKRFKHFCAQSHAFERYGSQSYLRGRSSLDAQTLLCFLGAL